MKKLIEPSNIESAKLLSPLEMNKIHFSGKHTTLSPDKLKSLKANEPSK